MCSPSPQSLEFGHFTGRQRNVPKCKTRARAGRLFLLIKAPSYVYVRKHILFARLVLPSTRKRRTDDLCKRIFSKTPARVDKFVNAQQFTFIYSRVSDTTCKRLRHRARTHAQSRFHGNSGSQAASFYSSVMHFRLSYRLRVDRRKRYVGGPSFTCGQKTLYTFTNVNVYVWTAPKPIVLQRCRCRRRRIKFPRID